MTRLRARATGAVYVLYFVTVIFATSLIGHVPAAYSDAANLLANANYVVLSVLLYRIFKPVSRSVALTAVAISVLGCVVQSLSLFHLTSPHSSLPIFGLFNITIGYLILRSTFLPRVLGVLMVLSGLGWLTVLSPDLVKHVGTYVEILGIVAEGSLAIWLLAMGVNVERWSEQTAAAEG
ncbi:MAG: DUF4386 domain-containing protein [Vulcanimicrobiaceae bacterium]